MIVCPVCETQVEFGFECDVCGKDLSAVLGALPPAPVTIQKMAELEQSLDEMRQMYGTTETVERAAAEGDSA